MSLVTRHSMDRRGTPCIHPPSSRLLNRPFYFFPAVLSCTIRCLFLADKNVREFTGLVRDVKRRRTHEMAKAHLDGEKKLAMKNDRRATVTRQQGQGRMARSEGSSSSFHHPPPTPDLHDCITAVENPTIKDLASMPVSAKEVNRGTLTLCWTHSQALYQSATCSTCRMLIGAYDLMSRLIHVSRPPR